MSEKSAWHFATELADLLAPAATTGEKALIADKLIGLAYAAAREAS
jgi:hypothetical protein